MAGQAIRWLAVSAGLVCAGQAVGQVLGPGGALVYRPGEELPRSMTRAEAAWLARNPGYFGTGSDVPTSAPTGPVECVAEYEPMDGILVSWLSQTVILTEMGKRVTTTGDATYYVVVPSQTVQNSAAAALTGAGADISRVEFITRSVNSIWIRDYGPRYIYEGDCRAIVDHQYNRPRPADDAFPPYFGGYKGHEVYELGLDGITLVHGGGNFHLDAIGGGYATRLITNENPWFTEPEVVSIWDAYQNLDVTLFPPFPTFIDATQHIDMWMQVVADDTVIISDWPSNPGSTQDVICDNAAALMASRGFAVHRTPAFSIGGTHYTYTNMVMCNDIVMIPSYTNTTVSPHNAAALAAIQAALPGKTIYQVPCQNIIGLAGAIHCIVMHVPEHRGAAGQFGGLAPTAYVKAPNGGETLTPGENVQVRWITDDDEAVSSVDVLLSTDGGATFPTVIGAAIPDTGSLNWTVPAVNTSRARIRVVARDALGNTGLDASDADFTIGSPCYANCDASTESPVLNVADFSCFLQRFAAADAYANCDGSTAEPVLNVADFSCFLQQFAAGCR